MLQLLSYAHEKHKKPFTQVGLDRLQQIGAIADHFPPHDCSLLFQAEEIRKVVASAGKQPEQVPLNENDGDDAITSIAPPTAAPTEKKKKEVDGSEDHTRCRYLRHYLNLHWASIDNVFRRQPIDHIREYFGESLAWYFAWAGTVKLVIFKVSTDKVTIAYNKYIMFIIKKELIVHVDYQAIAFYITSIY